MSRRHHRHKSRSFIGQLIHDIRRRFVKKSSESDSIPEVFDSFDRQHYISLKPESGTFYEDDDSPVHHSSHRRHKHSRRKKKGFIAEFIDRIKKNWGESTRERRHHRHSRRKHRKYKSRIRKEKRKDTLQKAFSFFKPSSRSQAVSSEAMTDTPLKHSNRAYWLYLLNSITLFIVAYLLVYLIYQFTVIIMASFWGLDSVLFYYDLTFNDYSPLWTRINIILITFSGPLISLVIGILFFRLFSDKVRGNLKLLFIWIALHGFNLFLSAWASGVSFEEGFGYVPIWLFMNIFWKIFFSLTFLFILGFIGYYSARKFLETSNSAHRVKKENRMKFLFFQALMPWFLGSLMILLIKMPNNLPYDTSNLVLMAFAMIPVLLNRSARPRISFEREGRRQTQVNWLSLTGFLLLLFAYRIGLNSGLHFIIKFKLSIDISPL